MSAQRAAAPAAAAQPGARSGDEYTAFCEGVRALCGVDLLQYKRGQMERRIRSFAERRDVTSLTAYRELLGRDRAELDAFLNRITINVSQLWRNPEQWDVLSRAVLPELAQHGDVRAWSAGCSYGAEAYTLAAVCRDAVPAARTRIVGTDIDARMVARAKAGHFSAADARSAPPALLERWFESADDGGFQARAELRAMVSFEVGDLLRIPAKPHSYDLILCRNTVIYFNEDVRDAVHARLAESLRPGGYLVIGATERVAAPQALGLVSAHPFTYRREA